MSETLRLVFAEDDADTQRLFELFLRKLGYSVDLVDSGHDLLDAVSEEPYSMIFTDIRMPGLDGLEAIRLIRQGEAGPLNRRTPIVAISALAMDSERHAGMLAGANLYITKPFTLESIRKALQAVLVIDAPDVVDVA